MPGEISALMREVLASPLGDVIASVGAGVAAAQEALDEASLAKTLEIYREGGDEMLALMREIGYQPTFYALPETTGEVVVSLKLGDQSAATQQASAPANIVSTPAAMRTLAHVPSALADRRVLPVKSYITPVDASFANRYGYSAQASTRLTFKIVPVPPPEGLERARVMPDLKGRDVATATLVLQMLGLPLRYEDKDQKRIDEPKDNAKVADTIPAAGVIVITDTEVVLTLE
jgi:hypothetical protein